MKKILVTGISGYLGPYLLKELALNTNAEVTGLFNNNIINHITAELLHCNLDDSEKLSAIFKDVNPDIVYHLASVTPTRITNQTEDYVTQFNSGVTADIAKLCRSNDALMIYTSTDLVYREGTGLSEDTSQLEPLTVYAKTKLLGEHSVRKFAGKYIIFRTSLVYGFTLSTYTSFFDLAYSVLNRGENINAFTDQYRNPVYSEDAAGILAGLPQVYSKNDIINLCGSEFLSRYDMCCHMADVFGFNRTLVLEGSSVEFTKYPMVKKLGLDNKKLSGYGFKTGLFRDNLLKAMKYKP